MKKKRRLPITDTQPPKKNPIKVLLLLLAVTAILVFVYELSIRYYFYEIVMWCYLVALCALLSAFFILNRGISVKPTLPEELPDEWSPAEKQQWLDAERRRRRAAKRLMYFILPLLVVFFIEFVDLYYADKLRAFFTALGGGGS